MRPDLAHIIELFSYVNLHLGQVERVELTHLGLFEGHHLEEHGPGREVALGDRVKQVSRMENFIKCIAFFSKLFT